MCINLHSLKSHHISVLFSQHIVAYSYCVTPLLWLYEVCLEYHTYEHYFLHVQVFIIPKV